MNLPQVISNRIKVDLSDPVDRRIVISILSELGVKENARVIRCILFAANGDLDKFDEMEALARVDYRDVIMIGEYERDTDKKLGNLNLPFNNIY